jgi:hypothetical protein
MVSCASTSKLARADLYTTMNPEISSWEDESIMCIGCWSFSNTMHIQAYIFTCARLMLTDWLHKQQFHDIHKKAWSTKTQCLCSSYSIFPCCYTLDMTNKILFWAKSKANVMLIPTCKLVIIAGHNKSFLHVKVTDLLKKWQAVSWLIAQIILQQAENHIWSPICRQLQNLTQNSELKFCKFLEFQFRTNILTNAWPFIPSIPCCSVKILTAICTWSQSQMQISGNRLWLTNQL